MIFVCEGNLVNFRMTGMAVLASSCLEMGAGQRPVKKRKNIVEPQSRRY